MGSSDQGSGSDEDGESGGRGRSAAGYVPGRRDVLYLAGGLALGAGLGVGGAALAGGEPEPEDRDDAEELSPKEVVEILTAGNARYVAGKALHPDQSMLRREGLTKGQKPLAAILSCADSRVPPEVLFDQGLGDLFVVRSAGQVIDHAVLGSLQYGVGHLEVPLLVVLGHSECGAVKATIEVLEGKEKPSGTDIDELVHAITPAVHEAEGIGSEGEELLEVSIGVNVERAVENLKRAAIIKTAVTRRAVKVRGAVYDLATGEVDWL